MDVHGIVHEVEDGFIFNFNVCFKKHNSMTSWSGKVFYADQDSFTMKWLMVSNDTKEKEWSSTRIGQDTFKRV